METIFKNANYMIPLADVVFTEYNTKTNNLIVVLKGSTWNVEGDCWNNVVYLDHIAGTSFISDWIRFREYIENPPYLIEDGKLKNIEDM